MGKPGREAVKALVPRWRTEQRLDFVIANGENAAGGAGLSAEKALELLAAGVDALTLGDHVWDQRGFEQEIGRLPRVCRPLNLPRQCPGLDSLILEKDGFRLAVATVLGRQFMNLVKPDCPFLTADHWLTSLAGRAEAALVEIHAEATSEKIALGWFLDGRAAAVLGTHTHIPTADATVLPRGTAYQTDVGMTGPYASVLGREVQPVVARFLDGMPRKFPVAEGDVRLCGGILELSPTGATLAYEPVQVSWSPAPRPA